MDEICKVCRGKRTMYPHCCDQFGDCEHKTPPMTKETKECCHAEITIEKGLYTSCHLPKGHEGICDPQPHSTEEGWRKRFADKFVVKDERKYIPASKFKILPEVANEMFNFIQKELDRVHNEALDWSIGCVRGGVEATMTVIKRRINSARIKP